MKGRLALALVVAVALASSAWFIARDVAPTGGVEDVDRVVDDDTAESDDGDESVDALPSAPVEQERVEAPAPEMAPLPPGVAMLAGLRGRVVDRDSNEPLEGVELALFPPPAAAAPWRRAGPDDVPVAPVFTDAEGRFRLPDLSDERMLMSLVARGEGLAMRQVRWGALGASIEAGEEITLRMTPAVRRSGTVTFSDGTRARDVDVGVRYAHSHRRWLQKTRTDELGRFELDLPDAAIEIEAFWIDDVREKVRIVEGDRSNIDIVLGASASTRIVVSGVEPGAFEGHALYLRGTAPSGPYTVRSGTAIIWVPSTRVLSAAIHPPDTSDQEWWFPVALANEIEIERGATNVVEFVRPRTGTIRVEVGDATFERLGALRDVSLMGMDVDASGWRNAAGRTMTIEGVPIGTYEVSTTHRRGNECPTTEVVVGEGESTTATL